MATPTASWRATPPSSSPWRWTTAARSSASRPGRTRPILFRAVELPAGQTVTIDLLVSGAFTGWSGDRGTFEHWLRPALNWFRSADLDQVEQETAGQWDDFIEPIPDFQFPKPSYAVGLRRSALAAALHADAEWGAIASGFDRGLSAYCWPREAIYVGGALARLGHTAIDRAVYLWLNRVRHRHRPFLYWFQKYSIDGIPEWETPAVDQSAMIPWGLERHYRRTGDRELVSSVWPMVEQAARVCCGTPSGHPGLRMLDDLNLISSAGSGDQLFAAFLYSNAAAVAGLRAAARLAAARGTTTRRGSGRNAPIAFGTAESSRSWRASVPTAGTRPTRRRAASSRPGASPSSRASGPTTPTTCWTVPSRSISSCWAWPSPSDCSPLPTPGWCESPSRSCGSTPHSGATRTCWHGDIRARPGPIPQRSA